MSKDTTTTVWLVEQGEFSDYHVVGVFDSQDKAQTIADAINNGDCWSRADVVERVLNEPTAVTEAERARLTQQPFQPVARAETAEARLVQLQEALQNIVDNAVGLESDPLWIVAQEQVLAAKDALSAAPAAADVKPGPLHT
jgi:hypothetical protein